MPVDSVWKLASECTTLIEYGVAQGWVERVRVAIEVLSRLVLRLEPEAALAVFDKALEFYSNRHDKVLSHWWLSEPVDNLLRRSWDAIPPDRRSDRVIAILRAPIVGIDGFQALVEERHPDPGFLLDRDSVSLLPERSSENEEQWQSIARLLIRGLSAGGTARRRAAMRLVRAMSQSRLTEAEVLQISEALWSAEHNLGHSLPENTDLYDWMFLVLPEPDPGLAEQRFRGKWLSVDSGKLRNSEPTHGGTFTVSLGDGPTNPARIEDILWNVGGAFSFLRRRGRTLGLSDDERQNIIGLVSLWAEAEAPSYPLAFMQAIAPPVTDWALWGLASILANVSIPEPVGEELYRKLKRLSDSGVPAFGPVGVLVQIIPEHKGEMESWLRSGLASGNREVVRSALSCLASWLETSGSTASGVYRPSSDLFREVGLIIAARRREALSPALEVARSVFDEGTEEYREAIRDYALQGLDYLGEELKYDRDHEDDTDVPFLRWRCVQLALSMSKAGIRDYGSVSKWLELATNDPLPEVRNAVASSVILR